MGFTMAERRKIRAEYAKKYRKAKKAEKTKILNEYLELLGKGSRKYEIYALNREEKKQLRLIGDKYTNVKISSNHREKRVYKKYYDDEVAEAVIKLWKFFRYICGERLVPLLRANLDVISRKRRFGINAEVKKKLAAISRSTVERLLTVERKKKHKLKEGVQLKKAACLRNKYPCACFGDGMRNSLVFVKLTRFPTMEGVKSTHITPGRSQQPMQPCTGRKSGH